jgi:hypothetical protein
MASTIQRVKGGGNRKSRNNDLEPDFYLLPPVQGTSESNYTKLTSSASTSPRQSKSRSKRGRQGSAKQTRPDAISNNTEETNDNKKQHLLGQEESANSDNGAEAALQSTFQSPLPVIGSVVAESSLDGVSAGNGSSGFNHLLAPILSPQQPVRGSVNSSMPMQGQLQGFYQSQLNMLQEQRLHSNAPMNFTNHSQQPDADRSGEMDQAETTSFASIGPWTNNNYLQGMPSGALMPGMSQMFPQGSFPLAMEPTPMKPGTTNEQDDETNSLNQMASTNADDPSDPSAKNIFQQRLIRQQQHELQLQQQQLQLLQQQRSQQPQGMMLMQQQQQLAQQQQMQMQMQMMQQQMGPSVSASEDSQSLPFLMQQRQRMMQQHQLQAQAQAQGQYGTSGQPQQDQQQFHYFGNQYSI